MRAVRSGVAGLVSTLVMSGGTSAPLRAAGDLAWDRIGNVEKAAAQIGEIQVRQGVEQAFKFISACYKTHGLASAYSKAFEGCIAQDYMVSKALVQIYSQIPNETLKMNGAPTAEQIDESFKKRASGAFALYKRTPADALALRGVVEQHGLPVFFKTVFPDGNGATSSPQNEKKQ